MNKDRTVFRMRLVGVLLLIVSVGLIIAFSDSIVIPERLRLSRLNVNEQSVPESIHLLRTIILYFILFTLAFGLLFLLDLSTLFKRFFGKYVDINRMQQFILDDRFCSNKRLSIFLFVTGTFFGTLLQLFFLINGDPLPEGFMEHISELILLLSAIIILISAFKVLTNPIFRDIKKLTIFSLLAIAAVLFAIFSEEIDWGQNIFKFNSFGVFQEYNYQHATNLHNFFNPLFVIMYPFIGMSSFVFFCIFWFFKKERSYLFNLLLPPPSLFILTFILACTAYMGHSEIYEELVYVFAFLCSLRILYCLSYTKSRDM